jgi:signal transduction histidine kinase
VIDNRLRLDDIGAPLAVLDDRARVLDATPSAAALITRFQLANALPAPLPVDLLQTRCDDLSTASVRELLHVTQIAADQMRRSIAGLLDFVRLGPPVCATQSLRETVDRVSRLLRPVFRAGQHELVTELHDEQLRLRGNPLTIEQIVVNLVVNATEACDRPVQIRIVSDAVQPGAGQRLWRTYDHMVRIRVIDDGPGIPAELRPPCSSRS